MIINIKKYDLKFISWLRQLKFNTVSVQIFSFVRDLDENGKSAENRKKTDGKYY